MSTPVCRRYAGAAWRNADQLSVHADISAKYLSFIKSDFYPGLTLIGSEG